MALNEGLVDVSRPETPSFLRGKLGKDTDRNRFHGRRVVNDDVLLAVTMPASHVARLVGRGIRIGILNGVDKSTAKDIRFAR